jgi:hypothetical protein
MEGIMPDVESVAACALRIRLNYASHVGHGLLAIKACEAQGISKPSAEFRKKVTARLKQLTQETKHAEKLVASPNKRNV